MTIEKNEGACGASLSDAELDRAAKLRADLEYVEGYLDSARQTEIETGLLMSAEWLLSDVRQFIARDDDERSNAE